MNKQEIKDISHITWSIKGGVLHLSSDGSDGIHCLTDLRFDYRESLPRTKRVLGRSQGWDRNGWSNFVVRNNRVMVGEDYV